MCCSKLQCAVVCSGVLWCWHQLVSLLQCVAVCSSFLQCVAVCCSVLQCVAVFFKCAAAMGWLQLVGSLKLNVSLENIGLFYRALLRKRPIILRSLLAEATPYLMAACGEGFVLVLHFSIVNSCCSVLQCVAVRFSVLQRVAVCCCVLQCVADCE